VKRILFIAPFLVSSALPQQDQFLSWMNSVAQKQLAARGTAIAGIKTVSAAEDRKTYVRARVLELIGGLPDYRGPLNAKITRTTEQKGYVIENVIFESLPQLFVTANVYRPEETGRHPAVLMPMGHWEQGKMAGQWIATNLALKGFVVMAFDPIGQGERQQAYDPRISKSIIGGSTEQHFMAGAQSILMGQSFARYRIWDGMRALDYLTSRSDVDPERIGCTGCSGGGTLTTYISALDPRVKVAAPACYMNSFRTLFAGPVGDSEQSFPNFLSSGLDQTDYVELFAPKPWLIASTQEDFFTPAGAKQVYEEARGWYRIFDAEDRIQWVVGPGGHGTPREVREAIYGWMIRWLKNADGNSKDIEVELVPDHLLRVTDKGQVEGRDIYPFIRDTPRSKGTKEELSAYLKKLIAANKTGLEPAISVQIGNVTSNRKPAVILIQSDRKADEKSERLLSEGNVVAVLVPPAAYTGGSRPYAGNWLANTRAWLIGHNLPAIRAAQVISVVDRLVKLPEVDPKRITAAGSGIDGVALLLAAAVDDRISGVTLDRTPYSYAPAFDTPVTSNLHDAVIPGFALKWDLPDLIEAIAPREVKWRNPTDWTGNVVKVAGPYTYTASDPNAE
jgi:cephalosporin-C deacetylase-like acetyl esterase